MFKSNGLTIGDLSRHAGVKVPTIRYYEEIGLMPAVGRTGGNQRRYGKAERERLAFIRHSRDLGFTIEDIRELLALSDRPDTPCDAAHAIASRQVDAIERRIGQLQALRGELDRIATSCRGGKSVSDCRIVHALSDHAMCAHDHDADAAQTGLARKNRRGAKKQT